MKTESESCHWCAIHLRPFNKGGSRAIFRGLCAGVFALLIAAIAPSAVLAIDNIRVSYATLSAAYMDHICAMDKGYFREEGINIEVIRAPGGVATPGLLSGQFQFSSSASSAVSAAVRGGPVKIIYTNLSRPTYSLVSIKPEITSAKDLVGKKSLSTVLEIPAISQRFSI